jgi:hypothetical protein
VEAGPLNVWKIFGQDRRNVVPLYQRPYVWDRETHWEPLWEDVRGIADRLLAQQPIRPHFLGAIVVDQQRKPMGHLETRLVIDGQQRLTTIQLLLQAFADLCVTAATESHRRALVKLTQNDDPLSQDPDEQFKVWPTNADREVFRCVMTAGSPAKIFQAMSTMSPGGRREVDRPQAEGQSWVPGEHPIKKAGEPNREGFAHLFDVGGRVRVLKGKFAGRLGTIHGHRSETGLWVVIDGEGQKAWSIADRRLERITKSQTIPPPSKGVAQAVDSVKGQPEILRTGHLIADAYLYFSTVIAKWLALDEAGAESRVEVLYTTMRDWIRMVVIDLGPEDDPQVIFETLNARGAPLLPSDLVKNFLFHLAQLQGQDIDPLYHRYWRPFDDEASYWRQEVGRGHARRARVDTFLQHYLTLRTGDVVAVGHLYTAFRMWANGLNDNASAHLQELQRYAGVYRGFDHLPSESHEALFFERLAAMDTTTAYPFLLELFAGYRDDRGVIPTILADLDSFLVRRVVCQLTTAGYNRFFVELLGVLRAADGAPAARVRNYLLSSEAESNRWPRDAEFRDAWLDGPLYRVLVRQRVRMLLEALERHLRTGKVEKIHFGEKLTIEHLLPQDWRKHWPLPGNLTAEEAEVRRQRALHTMGNLTLLTKVLNPAVSNGSWERKREEILVHSALNLNRQLPASWNELAIRQRGEALFERAKQIWPRPDR